MGVIYQHIKDDELPVLLRVCYEENNHDLEQTAHDLESIDMLLAVMKAKSLINRAIESGYTMLSEIPDETAEQWLKEKK